MRGDKALCVLLYIFSFLCEILFFYLTMASFFISAIIALLRQPYPRVQENPKKITACIKRQQQQCFLAVCFCSLLLVCVCVLSFPALYFLPCTRFYSLYRSTSTPIELSNLYLYHYFAYTPGPLLLDNLVALQTTVFRISLRYAYNTSITIVPLGSVRMCPLVEG